MQRLIVASSNKSKIKEIRELIGDKFDVVSMKDAGINVEVEENGTTFEENALIKAKTIYDVCHEPVVSDDSGLIVDALDGKPGVYSARYAGEGHDDAANNAKLLKNLEGVSDRSAKFCSAVVYYDGKRTEVAKGFVEGKIAYAPRGTTVSATTRCLFPTNSVKLSAKQPTKKRTQLVTVPARFTHYANCYD